MARGPTQAQLYDELLTRYGREIADAFMAAIADLATAADLQRLIAAVQAGNLDAAIAALNFEAAAYGPVLEAIRGGYVASGTLATGYFPARMVVRFDVRNPRAERWLQEESSQLVREIIEDQRVAVRQALAAGMERGENPRTTALSVVGRLDRATGKREGGILGLTSIQEQYARTARDELASGDPAQLRNYLTRARRDKRFDRTVKKAIEAGEPVPAETISRAIKQYRNRLLALRGEMIGRTESLTALRAAKHEAYLQAVDSGQIAEADVRRTWRDSSDLRVRHTHRVLDGDSVGLRQPFVSPSGARMMFPGDRGLGAPGSETINCRCDVDYRIDFLANVR